METRLTLFEDGSAPIGRVPSRAAPVVVLCIAFAILAGTLGTIVWMVWPEDTSQREDRPRAAIVKLPFDPAALTVADPGQLRTVSPEQAEVINAAIPVSKLPNPAAPAFIAPGKDLTSFARSLQCMTTAIYYEAATEPDAGQRAVAQVILNRMRHPAFPHSVCGVVYQGADRTTGCQFSFTCDGALARKPVPALWVKARTVAASALAGSVYAPVGLSTYYHADYVSPYWAGTLTKLAIVGRHIFYRLPGTAGAPAAFYAKYAGAEPDVSAMAALAATKAPAEVADPAAVADTPMIARPVLAKSGGTIDGNLSDPAETGAPVRTVPAGSRWVISRDSAPPRPQPTPSPAPAAAPSKK